MHRIIAMSDSHGALDTFQEAVFLAMRGGRIDTFVFLGDGTREMAAIRPILQQHNSQTRVVTVCGNNDFASQDPTTELFSVHGHHVMATHGHLFRVKFGLTSLSYAAQEQNATIVLFGHTHQPHLEEADGIWLVNPGAICNTSRKRSAYAEILIHESGQLDLHLIRWPGEEV